MPTRTAQEIFRRGSTTFFFSSFFFPEKVRADVTTLYAFVRTADDFVDQVPADEAGFHSYVHEYRQAYKKGRSSNPTIDAFIKLSREKKFDPAWTESFLHAMQQDLTKKKYQTLKDVESYIYGSANVIGLYLSRILGLSDRAFCAAEQLGKSFQFLNFIRDVAEDVGLGRNYFPQSEMKKFGLKDLSEAESRAHPEQFRQFMLFQIERYLAWNQDAEQGWKFLPREYLIPIKTASDLYIWTSQIIAQDPFVVYTRKVKPSKLRVLVVGLKNLLVLRKT